MKEGGAGSLGEGRAHESWLTKEDGGDPPLGIHGETFIEPEFTPVGISDQVPEPTVGDLMDDDVGQGAVPNQQAGGDKGQTRVLHSSKWKGWWHEEQVIPAERAGGQTGLGSPGQDLASFPQAGPSVLRDTATEEAACNPQPSAEMTPRFLCPPAKSLGPPFAQVLLSWRRLSETCSLFSFRAGYGHIVGSATVSSLMARLGSQRANRVLDLRRLKSKDVKGKNGSVWLLLATRKGKSQGSPDSVCPPPHSAAGRHVFITQVPSSATMKAAQLLSPSLLPPLLYFRDRGTWL